VTLKPISLKLRNFVKWLALISLIYGKDVFPRSFVNFLLLHLFDLRLEAEKDEKKEEVTVCRYKNGAEAVLCLSIDFDLLPSISFNNIEQIFHEATVKVLQLAKRNKVRISWGICGNLATQEPRAFKQVLYSSVNHDLGAHTFSHIDLSSPSCSVDTARSDILKDMEVLGRAGPPVSFIFPWNREGHLPLLKELGFVVYRGDQKAKIANPTRREDLWDIHSTLYLSEKSIDRVNIIRKLIDLTIAYGGVFHIWSHPWNMHIDRDVNNFMEKVLEPIFKHAIKRQKEGSLWICTMRELANYSEARRNCHIENFMKKRNEIMLTVHCGIDDPRFDFPPVVTLKIPLPPQTGASKVLIDGEEARKGESWRIVGRKWGKSHIFLTLSFEKPSRKIQVVTDIPPLTWPTSKIT